MPRRVNQIDGLVIDEISIVDKGANQHAKVTIAKSADGEKEKQMEIFDEQGNPLDPESLSEGDVVYDESGAMYQFVLDDEDELVDEDERELEPVGKSYTNPFRTSASSVSKAQAPESNFAKELREELSKAATREDQDVVISKALDRVEELSKAANEATEIAKAERQARLEREYTEIAKNFALPIPDDVLGATLLHCAENLSEQDCQVIAKCLEAASANVYAEQGAMGSGGGSDVLAEANAVISKAGEGANLQDFFEQNPAAYDEYLAGN